MSQVFSRSIWLAATAATLLCGSLAQAVQEDHQFLVQVQSGRCLLLNQQQTYSSVNNQMSLRNLPIPANQACAAGTTAVDQVRVFFRDPATNRWEPLPSEDLRQYPMIVPTALQSLKAADAKPVEMKPGLEPWQGGGGPNPGPGPKPTPTPRPTPTPPPGATPTPIPTPAPPSGIQSITAGEGLTGGTITTVGTIALEDFGIPGTYYKVVTDKKGRVKTGTTELFENDLPVLQTPGKVSGSAITSGTIGGSTSVQTTGALRTTSDVAANAVVIDGTKLQSGGGAFTLTLPAALPSNNGSFLAANTQGQLEWQTLSTPRISLQDLKSAAGLSQVPLDCGASQTYVYSSVTDQLMCAAIAISHTQVSGLGQAALLNVGTTAGTVAAGDDPRFKQLSTAVQNAGASPSIQAGELGERPEPGQAGRIFISVNEKTIYRDSGTEWTVISSATGSGGTLAGLTGDVSALGTGVVASTVNMVGGSLASDVHQTVIVVAGATSEAKINTLAKRDSAGALIASRFTGGGLELKNVAGAIVSLLPSSSMSASYALRWPTQPGTNGQVLATDGAGQLNWINVQPGEGGPGGGVTSVSAQPPLVSTGGKTPVLAMPAADGSRDGYLTSTDWNNFNRKLSGTLGAGQIFVGNQQQVPTAVTPGGDLQLASGGRFTVTGLQTTRVSELTPQTGQFLKYENGIWNPSRISLGDLRSTQPGLPALFPAPACLPSQSLTWVAMQDQFVCQNIAALDAAVLSSGTIAAARLPAGLFLNGGNSFGAAASIGTNDAQSFSMKTQGQNRVVIDANGKVGVGTATPQSALDVNGELRVGSAGTACAANNEGAQRYNSTLKKMEFCNGTGWVPFGGWTQAITGSAGPGASCLSFCSTKSATCVQALTVDENFGGTKATVVRGSVSCANIVDSGYHFDCLCLR